MSFKEYQKCLIDCHKLELDQLKSRTPKDPGFNVQDLKVQIGYLQKSQSDLLQDLSLKEERLSTLQLELDNRENEEINLEHLHSQIDQLKRDKEYFIKKNHENEEMEEKNLKHLQSQIDILKRENRDLKVVRDRERPRLNLLMNQNKLLYADLAKAKKEKGDFVYKSRTHPYSRHYYKSQ